MNNNPSFPSSHDQQNEQLKRNPWLILAATTLGVMMGNVDTNIVNVALPVLAHNYASSIEKTQWVISGYILVVCILLPICGRLSDIYTKRFIYLLGFAIFTVGSALCSIATSLATLVIYRLVQGVGGAMIMSNNQALVVMNVPQQLQGRALSINSMSASFGAIAGPAIGGFLLGVLSWRSIFYINIPIGILGCIIGYYVLPRDEKKLNHSLDIIGAVLFAAMVSCVLLLLNNCGSGQWVSWRNLLFVVVSVISGWFFVRRQYRVKYPTIKFSLFKNALYLHSNIAAFIVFLVSGGNGVLLPFYLHDILGFSPGVIGMLLFIGPCAMLFLAPISGYLTDKYSAKIFIAFGVLLLMLSLFFQGTVTAHTSLWQIVVYQIMLGSGFAFFHPPNNVNLFRGVATKNFGIASSINALGRNMGRAFGVVLSSGIFSLLFTSMLHSSPPHPYNSSFLFAFKVAFFSLSILMLVALYSVLQDERKKK